MIVLLAQTLTVTNSISSFWFFCYWLLGCTPILDKRLNLSVLYCRFLADSKNARGFISFKASFGISKRTKPRLDSNTKMQPEDTHVKKVANVSKAKIVQIVFSRADCKEIIINVV